jgi:hypothetical protein
MFTCGGAVGAPLPDVDTSVVGSWRGTLPNGAAEAPANTRNRETVVAIIASFIGFNLLSFISTVRSMERYGLI